MLFNVLLILHKKKRCTDWKNSMYWQFENLDERTTESATIFRRKGQEQDILNRTCLRSWTKEMLSISFQNLKNLPCPSLMNLLRKTPKRWKWSDTSYNYKIKTQMSKLLSAFASSKIKRAPIKGRLIGNKLSGTNLLNAADISIHSMVAKRRKPKIIQSFVIKK